MWDGRDASHRRDCAEACLTSNSNRTTAMIQQTLRDDWHQKHRRKAGSGRALFASLKYLKVHATYATHNGIVTHAFGLATLDDQRLHVKLLAIRRIHRLQSPM